MPDEANELSEFCRDVLMAGLTQFEQLVAFLAVCQMVKELARVDEQAAAIEHLQKLPALHYWFN